MEGESVMTTMKLEKLKILSARMGGLSSLPPIATKLSLSDVTNGRQLGEEDGLYLNYGGVECAYPYRCQDLYDRALIPAEYDAVVLENEFLRATFLPGFGGKLWSLFDRKKNRELLFRNDVVRPCNLGVRNAWLSGGIEWNAGFKGHGPFTCDWVHTAKFRLEDGTPALRFYCFERIRCAVVQMDFFLPDGSEFLFARMRITNPNDTVVPMYWWSNVGVEEKEGDRVIVPATQSYTAPDCDVMKIDIPVHNGTDVTYPARVTSSNDFFWTTENRSRRYICQLDRDGYGLCQTSTSRLIGRKLFVWGNSQGGHKWRNFLTEDSKSGSYDEIQCGLARTQYENLPMPPRTVWEWAEAYGAMQADPAKVHGTWKDARGEVESLFDRRLPEAALERMLEETRAAAKSPAEEVLFRADGWGALELLRRRKENNTLMNDHLDFGEIGPEQREWARLLEEGRIGVRSPEEIPASYQRQPEWLALLKRAAEGAERDNWYVWYLLGTAEVAEERYDRAEADLRRSVGLCETAWAHYALGVVMKKRGQPERACDCMLRAHALRKGDLSLVKELLRCLYECERSAESIALFRGENAEIRANERCLLYYAFALARTDRIAEAEKILCGKEGYLVVPDVRECELTVTQLWFYLRKKKGISDPGEPPRDLDFRMFSKREGWI